MTGFDEKYSVSKLLAQTGIYFLGIAPLTYILRFANLYLFFLWYFCPYFHLPMPGVWTLAVANLLIIAAFYIPKNPLETNVAMQEDTYDKNGPVVHEKKLQALFERLKTYMNHHFLVQLGAFLVAAFTHLWIIVH